MSRESKQSPAKGKKNAKSAERNGAGKAGAGVGAARSPGGSKTGPVSRSTGRTRQRVRPMLTSRAAILAVVVCGIALTLAYPLREYVAQRAHVAQLQEEREQMEGSIAHLEERAEELSEDEYVEREARTRLHYQYPEETAYIVVRPEDESDAEEEDESEEPWFSALWDSVEEADDPHSGHDR
ncbi:FtsB family cell division protein [Nocardiopsis kunsanensis]|uniref:Septum formation initiator family protein n=1 Tax=Nocardiopsis kunsanensis TaxID=141693 RepID=A0A918XFL3_9ACTN|nr:septum formation initiator family protein [Nocardiopsis kunsanensis]GHD30256.1 hypothetical protein GCM10007147_31860 [Nocardiopsis kunsanensis]